MEKTTLYDLEITSEVRFWSGGLGLMHGIAKNVDKDAFEKIKKDPLRDYLSYGVMDVTYVHILAWKIEKVYNKMNRMNKIITISDVDYSDEIESGELKGEYSDEFIREEMENYQTISISDVV